METINQIKFRTYKKEQILEMVDLMLKRHGSINVSVEGGANAYKLDPQNKVLITANN